MVYTSSEFYFLVTVSLVSFLIGCSFAYYRLRAVAQPQQKEAVKKVNFQEPSELVKDENKKQDGRLDFNEIVPGQVRAFKTYDRSGKKLDEHSTAPKEES